MLRVFLKFRARVKHMSQLERCHRVDCPCVVQLQAGTFVMKTGRNDTEQMKHYDKCLALSKKWHQKWPL